MGNCQRLREALEVVAAVVVALVSVDCLLVSFANHTRLGGEHGSGSPKDAWEYRSLNYGDPYPMESMTCEIDVDHDTRIARARGKRDRECMIRHSRWY